MAIHKIQNGRLVSTFWKWGDDLESYVVAGEREFTVTVTPAGEIYVDGMPFHRHLRSLQKWFQITAKGMDESDRRLPERPLPKTGWQNPCAKCPLSAACDAYDRSKDVNTFWDQTKDTEPRPGKEAEIIAPKVKKGKKNDKASISDRSNLDNDTGRIQDKTGIGRWEVD